LFWACVATFLAANLVGSLWVMWVIIGFAARLTSRRHILFFVLPQVFFFILLIKMARLPDRVLSPLFFTQFCLFLLFYNIPDEIKKIRSLILGLLILVPLHLLILKSAWYKLARETQFDRLRTLSTSASLEELPRDKPYVIVNTIVGASLEATDPFTNFSSARGLNIFELDWSFPGPIYQQRLQTLQLSDPFVDLATHRNVYLAVSVWDLRKVVYIKKFLMEHYNQSVQFEPAKIPGTDRDAVFPFFMLFQCQSMKPTDVH
jgi:hypothetical protein